MIFAAPQFDDLGEKIPATHWFWQLGNRWVAVDKQLATDWWDVDSIEARPTVFEYPIDHLPPGGTLVFVDVGGERQERLHSEPFVTFLNAVADLAKDGDRVGGCRHCGHQYDDPAESEVACEHTYPTYGRSPQSAWEVLTGLIGEARDIRRAQLEALGKE